MYNYYIGARCRRSQHALDLLYLARLKPKNHSRLSLNIGIWTAVRRTPGKDDIDGNNKLNNKITIICKEQTVVHHSNRHVAMNSECVQNETSYETNNYIFCLCATSLLLNSLVSTTTTGFQHCAVTSSVARDIRFPARVSFYSFCYVVTCFR